VGIAALCAAAAAAAAPTAPEQAIGCAEAADVRVEGTRILLGAIATARPRGAPVRGWTVYEGGLHPGHTLERPPLRGDAPWRWRRPARIAVRDGEVDVAVSVPLGWRDRVAVAWGDSPPAAAVRFARCAAPVRGWTVYEGGLHLRRRGDCVPLVVRVGGRSTTVRLGVGRACGATTR
jgi:hypothetical protein